MAKAPIMLKFSPTHARAQAWASERAAKLVTSVTETTRERLAAAVEKAFTSEGDVKSLVKDIVGAIGDKDRAQLIARTEVMEAANEGQREAWSQAVDAGLMTGDEQREWIATEDCCDECAALDGKTTDLDGSYPGDGEDGPPLHPNCRCTEGISAS